MGAFRAVVDRAANTVRGPLDARIFFLHVPKCGGTSTISALRRAYLSFDIRRDKRVIGLNSVASSRVISLTERTNYPFDTDDDTPIQRLREGLLLYFMNQADTLFISGHVAFSERVYQAHAERFSFVTMLRNPVDRWISSYFYNQYKNSHYAFDMDIETYLESRFGRAQGHEYVKFIGGIDDKGDYRSPMAVRRAIENLEKFNLVGCLEDLGFFTREFGDRFTTQLRIGKTNESPKSKEFRRSIITSEIRRKIEEICEPDLAVYEQFVGKVSQRKARGSRSQRSFKLLERSCRGLKSGIIGDRRDVCRPAWRCATSRH